MRILTAMAASASGLTAERLRMDVIAGNLANANTTRTEEGGAYRRRVPLFAQRPLQAGSGVGLGRLTPDAGVAGVRVTGVVLDPSPLRREYQPGHPDAGPDGYVELPNVEVVREMVDLMTASRAYEANATAVDVAKQMAMRALDIGRGV
ncbi:MAG: flagellar basal body rod protein FlgC [Bacillota bacterium]